MLTFTVYQLLSVLKPALGSGDLDPSMNMLISVRTRHSAVAPAIDKLTVS